MFFCSSPGTRRLYFESRMGVTFRYLYMYCTDVVRDLIDMCTGGK
jgi:hypothetical protein